MKTNQMDLSGRIAEITGLPASEVLPFLESREFVAPTTIERADKIINSKHSTPDQKLRAQEIKRELSKQKIEQSRNLPEAQREYKNSRPLDSELILLALDILILKSEKYSDITLCVRDHSSLPVEIREEHHKKIRLALIKLAIDLDTSIEIWKAFPFAGTDEEKALVAKTREYFTDMTHDSATDKAKAHAVYRKTPENHPLAKSIFSFALSFISEERELETHYNNHNQQYYHSERNLRDATCENDRINRDKTRCDYFETRNTILLKLDTIRSNKITDEMTEGELVDIIEESMNPDLTVTRNKAKENLFKIWDKKLNDDKLTFNEALESFQNSIIRYHNTYGAKFWNAINEKANSKAQVKKMLAAVKNTVYLPEAIRSWLIYKPGFEELFEEYGKTVVSYSGPILTELLKESDSFEKADRVLDLCKGNDPIHQQQVVLHLSTVIKDRNEGIRAIKKIPNNLPNAVRLAVLKSTLKFVFQPLELELVATCIKSRFSISDEEKRALIEKAIELLA